MKTLQILLMAILFATPLYAEQALVLSEIEKIQENLWYLQKDLAQQKSSFKEYQTELKRLDSEISTGQLDLGKRLATISESVAVQQGQSDKLESHLTKLTEALTSLTNEIEKQNSTGKVQTDEIETLERSLQALRSDFSAQQTNNQKAHAATQAQLDETRIQLEALGKDVGGRVEQVSLWGAGALLILAVLLTIGFALRKSPPKTSRPELKKPPRHEM